MIHRDRSACDNPHASNRCLGYFYAQGAEGYNDYPVLEALAEV